MNDSQTSRRSITLKGSGQKSANDLMQENKSLQRNNDRLPESLDRPSLRIGIRYVRATPARVSGGKQSWLLVRLQWTHQSLHSHTRVEVETSKWIFGA
jgi:hypothetical protein